MKRIARVGWLAAIAAAVPLLVVAQEAKKSETPKAPAEPAKTAERSAALATGTYQVDPVHSSNVFRIRHMNVANFYGRFNELAGRFTLDESDPSKCSFDVRIKTTSIDTNSAARDKHLKSPDFFDADQYPEMAFQSQSVKKLDDGSLSVSGALALRGITKPLTVTIVPTGSGKGMQGEVRFGLESTFEIKRSDFGMNKMVGPIGDDVRVTISIEAVKE